MTGRQYKARWFIDQPALTAILLGPTTFELKIEGYPANVALEVILDLDARSSVLETTTVAKIIDLISGPDTEFLPGSAAWLAYVATNADRIFVGEGDNVRALADLPIAAQNEWIRYWVTEKQTPRIRSSHALTTVVTAPKTEGEDASAGHAVRDSADDGGVGADGAAVEPLGGKLAF